MKLGIERIAYRRGVLEKGTAPEALPVSVWQGDEIPKRVLDAIQSEGLLDLGGTYGNKHIGDPVQYDCLELVMGDDVVKITFYNRAMALFLSDDERLKRIHRVMFILEEESER